MYCRCVLVNTSVLVCVCGYTCTHVHKPSPLLYHPVFFTRSTLHSLTLPEVLQCHKELLCLRVLSALLWIGRHWLLFPWRLADLICLPAVLIVTQVLITRDSPQSPYTLQRTHPIDPQYGESVCLDVMYSSTPFERHPGKPTLPLQNWFCQSPMHST